MKGSLLDQGFILCHPCRAPRGRRDRPPGGDCVAGRCWPARRRAVGGQAAGDSVTRSRGGGPPPGNSRPASRIRLVSSLSGGRMNVLVTPSEPNRAPRSTGFTRVTVRCPQCRPPAEISFMFESMGLPAETTSSLAALRRRWNDSLDLISSLVRPLTSSLSTGSSWG